MGASQEAGSKNLFGSYKNANMKEWDDVVRGYQKDNVALGELISQLVQNVVFDMFLR